MQAAFSSVIQKLPLWTVMSTLWCSLCASMAAAHEVVPTIADLTVADGTVRIEMRVNVEAQMSGIDLDLVEDTDNAENAADYDALRALSGAEVEAMVPSLVETLNAVPLLSTDGNAVSLALDTAVVPQVPNEELARITDVVLTGAVPAGTDVVEVAWPAGAGDLVLRQQGVDAPYTGLVSGGGSSGPIAVAGGGAVSGWQTFGSYVPVGFDHILPKGLDHILFVLGLFFLSTRLGPLLWQVTAFTLAHTVTLALGALGIVNLPGSIVEPLIAASIVYVAVENIFARGLNPWRPAIVFGFGLLHGLGFASVLGEFGLPEGQFIPALIGFNVGVEIGQLTVIALAAIALWLGVRAARMSDLEGQEETITDYNVMFRAWSMTGSLLIAVIAIYWVIERTLL
ncbi:HupE/UreJ family protein [Tateyamaria omphalii]|uniref:HupE/UreJ family protein n=1 Tax=Tateyamaria omphalii TaxID=299262 RepID=UPI001C9A22D6|nr:HupE/UreJ family protein [Tateyamaria omphalii]MBY5932460.1 HupE/UreJ family protein [Tateyamaria omphalii]